jgi:hypothetical protein
VTLSITVPVPAPTREAITIVARQVNVAWRGPPIASDIAMAVNGKR